MIINIMEKKLKKKIFVSIQPLPSRIVENKS